MYFLIFMSFPKCFLLVGIVLQIATILLFLHLIQKKNNLGKSKETNPFNAAI